MSNLKPVQAAPTWADNEPPLPDVSHQYELALDNLSKLFAASKPLAVVIGEGKTSASSMVRRFVTDRDDDVTVAHLTKPNETWLDAMREIIAEIGFDPKDMSVANLEKVFRMFLKFQKKRQQRTLLCIDNAEDSGPWMLEDVCRLVELETEERFGLMVLLSGEPGLAELLYQPPLDKLCAGSDQRITLSPFTLAETRSYIRWRIESGGAAEIADVFEFDAISRIHELSGGVQTTVDKLCRTVLQAAGSDFTRPISTKQVIDAGKLLDLSLLSPELEPEPEPTPKSPVMGAPAEDRERLIVRIDGILFEEQVLNRDRTLLGRAADCDVRLTGTHISRHHALVLRTSSGVQILDLSSTNGTWLNGERVKEHKLSDADVVSVPGCTIEYIAGRECKSRSESDRNRNSTRVAAHSPIDGTDINDVRNGRHSAVVAAVTREPVRDWTFAEARDLNVES